MKRLLTYIIFFSIIFCHGINYAQSNFKKVGTVGYTFLKLPVTARQAAMGETAGGIVRNAGIMPLFLNPAVLGFQKTNAVGFGGANWIADINHYVFGATYQLASLGAIGIGINYVDYGNMPHTERTGAGGEYTQLGTYTAQSKAIGLTYSRQLTNKFAWGLRLNYIREDIYHYSSTNVLADVGVLYYTGFNSLRIGGFINNFGVDSRFIGDTFKMPTELRLNLAYDLVNSKANRFTLAMEMVHPSDNVEKVHIGFEYGFKGMLFLRGGYRYKYDEDTFAFGGGIRWHNTDINLAVTPFGRFPTVYRVGAAYEF